MRKLSLVGFARIWLAIATVVASLNAALAQDRPCVVAVNQASRLVDRLHQPQWWADVADIDSKHFSVRKFELTADNWTPHEILRAILPPGEEGVSGFSIIGHILHLNLRSDFQPVCNVTKIRGIDGN